MVLSGIGRRCFKLIEAQARAINFWRAAHLGRDKFWNSDSQTFQSLASSNWVDITYHLRLMLQKLGDNPKIGTVYDQSNDIRQIHIPFGKLGYSAFSQCADHGQIHH